MPRRRHNTQLFALAHPPPEEIELGGRRYRLVRVFKHDFYAATSLYEALEPADIPRIVVKIYRTQPFWGLPMRWLGRASRNHERATYRALAGLEGIPRWAGSLGQTGCAIEYIDAAPLDHVQPVPEGYFDRARRVLDGVHARGVAYVDANKRSNFLVGPGGEAFLVDFQIALRRRDDWPWPLRALVRRLVRYLQEKDLYHLLKHKRRLAPGELSEEEEALSRRRSGLHALHRRLIKPYKALRRWFLRRQYRSGRLVSPSAELEDHHQPEKQTWREP